MSKSVRMNRTVRIGHGQSDNHIQGRKESCRNTNTNAMKSPLPTTRANLCQGYNQNHEDIVRLKVKLA